MVKNYEAIIEDDVYDDSNLGLFKMQCESLEEFVEKVFFKFVVRGDYDTLEEFFEECYDEEVPNNLFEYWKENIDDPIIKNIYENDKLIYRHSF